MSTELYKLFKSSTFKIMLLSNIIITIAYVGICISMARNPNIDFKVDLSYVLRSTLGDGPVLSVLCGIFVAMYTLSEFQNGSIEIIITSGKKRITFILFKLLACIFGGLILYILHNILGVTFYGIFVGWDKSLSSIGFYSLIRSIFLSLIVVCSLMSIYFFFSMLLKNMVGTLIMIIIGINLINTIISKIPIVKNLMYCTPNWLLGKVALNTNTDKSLFLIISSFGVIAASFIGSYVVFRKYDVKG